MWRNFKKGIKPKKNGWYLVTLEFNQGEPLIAPKSILETVKKNYYYSRMVMDLYYKDGRWYDNRVRNVFETYTVLDIFGKRLYKSDLCDRTDSVIRWKPYRPYFGLSYLKECINYYNKWKNHNYRRKTKE